MSRRSPTALGRLRQETRHDLSKVRWLKAAVAAAKLLKLGPSMTAEHLLLIISESS
jgi:hypothetical protein